MDVTKLSDSELLRLHEQATESEDLDVISSTTLEMTRRGWTSDDEVV